MTTLVVGATGATGRHLVQHLLERGESVRAVVRSPDSLPQATRNHPKLSLIQGTVLDLPDDEVARHVNGCAAVASCLGHTLSFRGMFGPPYRLVTQTARKLCAAIRANRPHTPVKLVLMNTTACRNPSLDEPMSARRAVVLGLLRVLLPPHTDNEQAAALVHGLGQDPLIQWAVVRPDNLIHATEVTPYELRPSPVRDPIFDAGQTSRINVGHFMAELITNPDLWAEWRESMPVIYNSDRGWIAPRN